MLGLPFGPNTSGYDTGFSKEETTQLNTKEYNGIQMSKDSKCPIYTCFFAFSLHKCNIITHALGSSFASDLENFITRIYYLHLV